MISSTITDLSLSIQASKDRAMALKDKMLRNYVKDVILEHAVRSLDSWSLYADDLPFEEQKLFLSYLLNIADYEDACQNLRRLMLTIREYIDEMQYFIDQQLDSVHADYIASNGFSD